MVTGSRRESHGSAEATGPPLKRLRTTSHEHAHGFFVTSTSLNGFCEQLSRATTSKELDLALSLNMPSAELAAAAHQQISTTTIPDSRARIEFARFLQAAKEGRPPEGLKDVLQALHSAQEEITSFSTKVKERVRATSPKKYDKELFARMVKELQRILMLERDKMQRPDEVDGGLPLDEALSRMMTAAETESTLKKMALTKYEFLAKAVEKGAIQSQLSKEGVHFVRTLVRPHRSRNSTERSDRERSSLTARSEGEDSSLATQPVPMSVDTPSIKREASTPTSAPRQRESSAAKPSSTELETAMRVDTDAFRTPSLPPDIDGTPLPSTPEHDRSLRDFETPPLPESKVLEVSAEGSPPPEAMELMALIDQCLVALYYSQVNVPNPTVRDIRHCLNPDAIREVDLLAKERLLDSDKCLLELLDAAFTFELLQKVGILGWHLTQKGEKHIAALLRHAAQSASPTEKRTGGRQKRERGTRGGRGPIRQRSEPPSSPRRRDESQGRNRSLTSHGQPPRGPPLSNADWDIRPLMPILHLKAWDTAGWVDVRALEADFHQIQGWRSLLDGMHVSTFLEYAYRALDEGFLDFKREMDILYFDLTEKGEQNRH